MINSAMWHRNIHTSLSGWKSILDFGLTECPYEKISDDLIWFYLISCENHLIFWFLIWLSDSQMRISFSHMSFYFSHITSDAHLIVYLISASQINSHVFQYDLWWSDYFLILLPVLRLALTFLPMLRLALTFTHILGISVCVTFLYDFQLFGWQKIYTF